MLISRNIFQVRVNFSFFHTVVILTVMYHSRFFMIDSWILSRFISSCFLYWTCLYNKKFFIKNLRQNLDKILLIFLTSVSKSRENVLTNLFFQEVDGFGNGTGAVLLFFFFFTTNLNSPKLISRKSKATEKFLNFHTV